MDPRSPATERGVPTAAGAAWRRRRDIHPHDLAIDKRLRADLLAQGPCVVWFTGLSAAGKSTIADLVERRLHSLGYHTYLLDGDDVRDGLNSDLGFSDGDRAENVRRVAEVARLMVEAGLITIVAFISPFRSERQSARALVAPGEFVEVYVNTPLTVAAQRDPKGLYAKARRGELERFTGIDSPYEPPDRPELEIRTTECTPAEASDRVIDALRNLGRLDRAASMQRPRRDTRR